MVSFEEHENLARGIAENAQRFAATHLTGEGRHCHIKAGGGGGAGVASVGVHAPHRQGDRD